MRKRSFHRTSGRKVRLFWVRNTGSLVIAGGGQLGVTTAIFDPLQYLPDSGQRADIAADVTLMHLKFNFATETGVTANTGTAKFYAHYYGIYLADRNAAAALPSFTNAADARTDWLDCWMDSNPAVTGNDTLSQYTLGMGNQAPHSGAMRVVKAKRKLRSQDVILFSGVSFPLSGTVGGAGATVTTQWQASALLRVG